MKAITGFSLEKHSGPYELWPMKSGLLRDGVAVGASLPGYNLLGQFEGEEGYLFITDHDCPFEEIVEFTLLDPKYRRLSNTCKGAPYDSWNFERARVIGGRTLEIVFWENEVFHLHIRTNSIPLLVPKLKLTRQKTPVTAR